MMIAIKDMEMPKDCIACPMQEYESNIGRTRCTATCRILSEYHIPIPSDVKPDFCPLIEIKTDEDTISRAAAIDAICAVCGNDCDKSEFVYNAPQDEQVILCPEHYCLCNLPSAQPEQRWIPCGERLPEDDVEVLITDDSGGVQWLAIDKMLSYEDGSGRFWVASQNPTAWMPLPEPYQEGEQDG